ncbi:hypothetical protein [Sphingomonas sp. GB1N7]|uniref:hypothetical protein n=1 Tax=Parasphingomonas caseinilytica TaxID=3096158 RepID=UPI002FCB8125
MKMIVITIAAAAATFTVAFPAVASPKRVTQTSLYRVSYDPARDVYCIRFYADSQAADPRPGGPGINCRSRQAWATDRVFIDDSYRDRTQTPLAANGHRQLS